MPDRFRRLSLLAAGLLLLAAATAGAQTYLDLEGQVQEFTLDNGVNFLVLEHHDVPVFSFRTFVNVGSANETRGITGSVPHPRAHGLQGHGRDRHDRLQDGAEGDGGRGCGLRRAQRPNA